MPSIKTTTPILGGSYYHIFNRGINRQNIFFEKKNYLFFLELMKKYLTGYIDILAYCLLPNHFHWVVKVNDEIEFENKEHFLQKERFLTNEVEVGKVVSKQLKRLFISYAMSVNKQENRVGALFDAKFKRLEITEQEYLEYAIFYVHYNPQKHGLMHKFKNYNFSSYKAIMSDANTNINRQHVFEIFGGKTDFELYHNSMHEERQNLILE